MGGKFTAGWSSSNRDLTLTKSLVYVVEKTLSIL